MKHQMDKLITDLVEGGVFFLDAVSEFEKSYIRRVLEVSHGTQCQAAKALGIHRNTLSRKMEQYKLSSKNGVHRDRTRRKKTPPK